MSTKHSHPAAVTRSGIHKAERPHTGMRGGLTGHDEGLGTAATLVMPAPT